MMLGRKLLISMQRSGGRAGTRTPDLLRVNYQVAVVSDANHCSTAL